MSAKFSIKKLTVALTLAAAAQSGHALTVAQINAGPHLDILFAGGAAQDPVLDNVITANLAAAGTFDEYFDATSLTSASPGSRYRAYAFTLSAAAKAALVAQGYSGPDNIVIYKRSTGGAGYGVIPLIEDAADPNGIQGIKQLNILGAGAVLGPKQPGEPFFRVNGTFVPTAVNGTGQPHAGITGVNAALFRDPQYPETSPLVTVPGDGDWFAPSAQIPPATFDVRVGTSAARKIDQIAAGGLTFGLAVTQNLYRVLQAAQKASGQLPAATVIGATTEAATPTLSRNFVASLLAGKIGSWNKVRVVRANGAGADTDLGPLTGFAAAAGVPLPLDTDVAVGARNRGAAVGAIFNAVFLGWPKTGGAFAPAVESLNANNNGVAYVVQSTGTGQQDQLLVDWQNGTNLGGKNTGSATRWGVAEQSIDVNTNYAKPYRYVKIDGFAPLNSHVASGNYPVWSEQFINVRTNLTAVPGSDDFNADKVIRRFAAALGTPAVAAAVNTSLGSVIGSTGLFAVSTGAGTPATLSAVYNPAAPVVPYTHRNGSVTLDHITPVINSAKGNAAASSFGLK